MNHPFRGRKRLVLVTVLSFMSLLFLIALRYFLAGKFAQGYLIWNLVLAAVPVWVATLCVYRVGRHRGTKAATVWGIGGFLVWLVFYPNAPYLFTDFIHVIRRSNLGSVAAPWMSEMDLLWYDIVMNSAFAFVGHYLGLVSMYLMHGAMRTLFGRIAGWSMMIPAILLSGLGIHLGRFSRFNSWDLVFNPMDALRTIRQTLGTPSAVLFSLAFSFFIALTYVIFYLVKRDDAWDFAEAERVEARRL